MKKLLDRVWDWIKTTAWFQVVCLVGVVVGIVLCIAPITKAITSGITEAERTKYLENNRINYNSLINKIKELNKGGEEFAVIFGTDSSVSSDLQKGLQAYSERDNAVKVYYLDVNINEDNKSTYNVDENYYNYYQVTKDQLEGLNYAVNRNPQNGTNIYQTWYQYSENHDNDDQEVKQTTVSLNSPDGTISGALPVSSNPLLMWFRATKNIDEKIKDASIVNDFNYHIAKVYATIQDTKYTSSNVPQQYESGLVKFFRSSSLSD